MLACGATRVLTAALAGEIPRIFAVGVDGTVIVGSLLLVLITGVLFGMVPALRSRRPALQELLAEGSRSSAGRGRQRLQGGLVIVEMTLTLVLLIGAGLMTRSFVQISGAEIGLVPENVLTLDINLPEARYPEPARRTAFYFDLLDRIRTLPGVVSAATTYILPFGPISWEQPFHVEESPPPDGEGARFAAMSAVSADYFRTMGISLLAGREFTRSDDGTGEQRAVIVDEQIAAHYWPGENPLGKRLAFGPHDMPEPVWMEVVGVVDHITLFDVTAQSTWQMYRPHAQINALGYQLVVKTAADPLDLVEPIREQILALDPELPIARIQAMEEYIRASNQQNALLAILFAIFGGAALLLAAVGIYSVVSFATVERRHEIGIRMALGARRDHLLGMIIGQGLMKVGIGIGIGLPLAALLGMLSRTQLFEVSVIDPVTFVAAPLFLGVIAVVATWIPAWRTTRVNPVESLRPE